MVFTYQIVTLRDYFYLDSAACLVFAAFRDDHEAKQAKSKHALAYVVGAIMCASSFLEVRLIASLMAILEDRLEKRSFPRP